MACLNQWPFHQSSWQEPTNKCQAATVNTSVVEDPRSLNWATWNTISSVLSTSHQFVHVWCAWNMVSATWFSMHARSMHVAIHVKNCHTMTHVCHDFNVFEHIGWCQLWIRALTGQSIPKSSWQPTCWQFLVSNSPSLNKKNGNIWMWHTTTNTTVWSSYLCVHKVATCCPTRQ